MNSLARQNIRALANYLYKIEGQPLGRAKEHWLAAEQQLSENLFRDNPASSCSEKSDAASRCRP